MLCTAASVHAIVPVIWFEIITAQNATYPHTFQLIFSILFIYFRSYHQFPIRGLVAPLTTLHDTYSNLRETYERHPKSS